MASAIHQFVAGYSLGDAISNEARIMRSTFRGWGYESKIFSEYSQVLPELHKDSEDAKNAKQLIRPDDIVLLHLSIGSIVNDVFMSLTCRKAILYHNMTPADYARGVQEEIAHKLAWGRDQARGLAGKAQLVMADSRFNANELIKFGYGDVHVMPLMLDFSMIRVRPDRKTLKTLIDGKTNILFVGRCAPNKRIEDILSAFFYFQRFVEPRSRLILVGSFSGMERYHMLLLAHAQSLELNNVLYMGSVRQPELAAAYQAADMFLCMSEHEGFCIPLLESMAHDVPILAYAAAAVPETLDGAGILFHKKRFDLISEMMGMMTKNKLFRESLISGQQKRLEQYESRDIEAELKEHLQPLIG